MWSWYVVDVVVDDEVVVDRATVVVDAGVVVEVVVGLALVVVDSASLPDEQAARVASTSATAIGAAVDSGHSSLSNAMRSSSGG